MPYLSLYSSGVKQLAAVVVCQDRRSSDMLRCRRVDYICELNESQIRLVRMRDCDNLRCILRFNRSPGSQHDTNY